MNVRLAILFAAVAEERSFTRAAVRLNIAQPWLSAQIRKFEEQLGFPLFHRSKGRIELTDEGEQMLPLSSELAQKSDQLRMLGRSLAQQVSLHVRAGANAFSESVAEFARLNDGFVAQYHDSRIVVEAGRTEPLLDDLRTGRLDVALLLAPFDVTGLKTIMLRETAPYLLAERGSRFGTLAAIRPADLAEAQIGVMRRAEHPGLYDTIHGPIAAAGADLKALPEMGRAAMEHFARSQHMPVLMVEGDPADYAGDPDLIARPLDGDARIRQILAVRVDLEKRAVHRYWRNAGQIAMLAAPARD